VRESDHSLHEISARSLRGLDRSVRVVKAGGRTVRCSSALTRRGAAASAAYAAPSESAQHSHGGQSAVTLMGQMAALRRPGAAELPPPGASGHGGDFLRRELAQVRARMTISPLDEPFIGYWLRHSTKHKRLSGSQLCDAQRSLQALYESRFASTERLIGFFALFHAMAAAVAAFFPAVSLGCLGYDMSRSQALTCVYIYISLTWPWAWTCASARRSVYISHLICRDWAICSPHRATGTTFCRSRCFVSRPPPLPSRAAR